MNPVALTGLFLSALILYLLFTGKWDRVVDIATGHKPPPDKGSQFSNQQNLINAAAKPPGR